MLPRTRRPSATTGGSASKVESSSTSCATARVASDPEPIATPMSASFNASASFTPSPVIATVCPRPWSALTIARFCCGVTRPNTECRSTTSASASPSSGSSRASNGSIRSRQAQARRDRAHGARIVAGDHLHRHVLLGEVAERVGRIGTRDVAQHDDRDRSERSGEPLVVETVRVGEQDHAVALLGLGIDGRQHVVVARAPIEEHVGRAEEPRALALERDPAPLARRRERDRVGHAPARRGVRVALADRAHRGVRGGVVRRERGQGPLGGVGIRPLERVEPFDRELPFGERAGLVDAQHVHAREPLDGLQLLHEHPLLREAHDGDRERQRGQQHEALGHHRHGAGHRPGHGLPPRVVRAQLAEEEQRRGRHDRVRHVGEDRVDPRAQLRARDGEPAGVLGDLHRVGLVARPSPRGTARSPPPRTTPTAPRPPAA